MLSLSKSLLVAVGIVGLFAGGSVKAASLTNGGFQQLDINDPPSPCAGSFPSYCTLNKSLINGWQTTDVLNEIEIWKYDGSPFAPPAYEGDQYAELNANSNSTLFQDVAGISAGSQVGYQFAHRGRNVGNGFGDVMQLTITDLGSDNIFGGVNDTTVFSQQFTDLSTAWGFYSNANAFAALGNTLRFSYSAISTSTGSLTEGNFIDAVQFGVPGGGGTAVPGPLPVLGAGAAFGFSRRLRRRIQQSQG